MATNNVYTWYGTQNFGGKRVQCRYVVAGLTRAEIACLVGVKDVRRLWNFASTGNNEERKFATAHPKKIYWRNSTDCRDRIFRRAEGYCG